MAITTGPARNLADGELVDDGKPSVSAPGTGNTPPDVVRIIATKEDIQDYVAELFTHNQHVNASFDYDDDGNLLTLTFSGNANSRYEHDQPVAATAWVINHNFGRIPFSVHVVDSSGDDVIGDIIHDNVNTTRIIFSAAFAGKAYLGA